MQNFKYIVLSALLLTSSALFAQQEGLITNYRYHMNNFNPAFVGVDGETLITSSFRQQWTGIEDAPSAQVVSFGTALGKNLGLGVSIYNSNSFVESQTFTGIDVSYKIKIAEATDLYLGVKAGGNFYRVNTAGLETFNIVADPGLSSISNFNPNVGVGAVLKKDAWFASVAVPRILTTERAENNDALATAAEAKPHIYATAGYDLVLNESRNLMLKPSAMVRYVSGAPFSADINTMLSFNNKFDVGATYRTDEAFAALVNFSIKQHLIIGYAYETSTRKYLAAAKNTNEFLLRFLF